MLTIQRPPCLLFSQLARLSGFCSPTQPFFKVPFLPFRSQIALRGFVVIVYVGVYRLSAVDPGSGTRKKWIWIGLQCGHVDTGSPAR